MNELLLWNFNKNSFRNTSEVQKTQALFCLPLCKKTERTAIFAFITNAINSIHNCAILEPALFPAAVVIYELRDELSCKPFKKAQVERVQIPLGEELT